jgi:hypothetical protein
MMARLFRTGTRMLKLGRLLLLVLAIVAGFAILVLSLKWQDAYRAGVRGFGSTQAYLATWTAILGVTLLARRWLGQLQRAHDREELEAVRGGHAFEASGSPWMLGLFGLLLLLFGFGVYGGIARHDPGMALVSAALALLFLFLGSELARQALRPGPMLRMDARGIEPALYGPIPWNEVIGLQLQSVRIRYSTQHTLFLGVRKPLRYLRNAPPLTRWLQGMRLRNDPAYGALSIGLNILGKDPQLVYDSALALRRANDAPMLEHWHQRMDANEVDTWLRRQELSDGMRRLQEEMETLPRDPTPEQVAAFDAKLRTHMEREQALHPEMMAAIRNSTQRMKKDTRTAKILGGIGIAMFALWIWAKLA